MYKVIDQSQDEYMKKMWIMYIKKIIINYLFFPYCQLVNLYNEIDTDKENIIGAPKIQNTFSFFNIASHIVIALPTLW